MTDVKRFDIGQLSSVLPSNDVLFIWNVQFLVQACERYLRKIPIWIQKNRFQTFWSKLFSFIEPTIDLISRDYPIHNKSHICFLHFEFETAHFKIIFAMRRNIYFQIPKCLTDPCLRIPSFCFPRILLSFKRNSFVQLHKEFINFFPHTQSLRTNCLLVNWRSFRGPLCVNKQLKLVLKPYRMREKIVHKTFFIYEMLFLFISYFIFFSHWIRFPLSSLYRQYNIWISLWPLNKENDFTFMEFHKMNPISLFTSTNVCFSIKFPFVANLFSLCDVLYREMPHIRVM